MITVKVSRKMIPVFLSHVVYWQLLDGEQRGLWSELRTVKTCTLNCNQLNFACCNMSENGKSSYGMGKLVGHSGQLEVENGALSSRPWPVRHHGWYATVSTAPITRSETVPEASYGNWMRDNFKSCSDNFSNGSIGADGPHPLMRTMSESRWLDLLMDELFEMRREQEKSIDTSVSKNPICSPMSMRSSWKQSQLRCLSVFFADLRWRI